MSTFQVEGPTRTFEAGSDIIKGRRVSFATDGAVDHSTEALAGIGVAQRNAATGEAVPVRLWTAEGTWQVEADGAITSGFAVEGANEGKVSAGGSTGVDLPLKNLSASTTADGDFLEVGRLLVGIV